MYSLDYSDALLLYYLFFAKIIPLIVTFLFERYLKIKIEFKSVSLFSASIANVVVRLPGFEITVGEIGLKTKYLSSKYKKPLCIALENVKVFQSFEANLEARPQDVSNEEDCNISAERKSKRVDDIARKHHSKTFLANTLAHLLRRLPPIAMIFAQFLEVQLRKVSLTILNKEKGPLLSVDVPTLDAFFDVCVIKNSRVLFIALSLQHIRSKFFAFNKQNPSVEPNQACLAEIVLDISLEARIAWCEGKLLYEKLNVTVSGTQVTFNGGLFDIIEHFMLHLKLNKSPQTSPEKPLIAKAPLDVEKLIETIAPDLLTIHVENTEVKSLNKHNSYHYHLLLQHIAFKGRLKSSSTSRLKISNLRIYSPAHEVLYSKELLMDAKSSGNLLVIGTKLDTFHMVYNHDDIYGWFLKIFTAGMKSNRKELILKAFRTANKKMLEFYHSEFVQKLFKRIIPNARFELRDTRLVFQLSDQVSSVYVSKANIVLQQSEDLRPRLYETYAMNLMLQDRHWRIELSSDGPICWYMDQKFDYIRDDSKRIYVRGSAVFLGSSSIHLSSHEDSLQITLRVNTLRTEYSQKLTSFVLKSIKSSKEYFNLFSQLKNTREDEGAKSNEKVSISIENVLNGIMLDAKVTNISFFFINRHDVCAFVDLHEFASIDSFNYSLHSLQVSMIDFAEFDPEIDLSDFFPVYISTKSLNLSLYVINDQPQFGVDFTDELMVSWNAHFIRHLLSIVRDVNRFRSALGLSSNRSYLIPRSLPMSLDIKKLRNISIKHADVNVDKFILLINELSGENLFFNHYFS